MGYRFGSCLNLCVTCEYWIGPRQPDYFCSGVEVPSQSVMGKCWCKGGPFFRADRMSNTSACTRYKKWEVLD